MKGRSVARRQDDTLRRKLLKFKDDHLKNVDVIGSFPEKVRLALEGEIDYKKDEWPLDTYGKRAIVEFFMSGIWRSEEHAKGDGDDDEQEQAQGSFEFYTFGGTRLPRDLTYHDPTAGKYKMRTVGIEVAEIWQWQKAGELRRRKAREADAAADRHDRLGESMLALAGGELTAKIIDLCDQDKRAA